MHRGGLVLLLSLCLWPAAEHALAQGAGSSSDPNAAQWLEKSLRFWERAPVSTDYRYSVRFQRQGRSGEVSGSGEMVFGGPSRFRMTMRMAIRSSGTTVARSTLVAVADGEAVWTEAHRPGAALEVSRFTLEQYEQMTAGVGGTTPSDPMAQLRMLQEVAHFEVVEEGEEQVTLRGSFTDDLEERLGASAELFGADPWILLTLDPDSGAPRRYEIGGGGQARLEMSFEGLEVLAEEALPEDAFVYRVPDGVVVQQAGAPSDATADQVPTVRYSGYLDETGEVVIDPVYASRSRFSDGLAEVTHAGSELSGYIDGSGRMVIEPEYFRARSFTEGLAAVALPGGDYGYIDRSGEWVIEPRFSSADPFAEGLALVSIDGEDAWIDQEGEVVIRSPTDVSAGSFSSGVATLRDERRLYGLIDRSGAVVLEPRFERMRDAVDGFAAVQLDDRWGYVDVGGKVVVEPRFEAAGDFGEGLAPVRLDGEWSYIDSRGNTAIAGPFEFAAPFLDGLGLVQVDGRWGFVDPEGRLVIEPRFVEAGPYSEGLAAVRHDGRFGFLDKSGDLVIEPRFQGVDSFSGGRARFTVEVELTGLLEEVLEETEWAGEAQLDLRRRRRDETELRSRVESLKDELRKLESLAPSSLELDAYAVELERLGAALGVAVELEHLEEVEHERWIESRIAIAVRGEDPAVERFVERLRFAARLTDVVTRRDGASEARVFETAIYWFPPVEVAEPRACRRFAGDLEASSSTWERNAVEVLEGICDELDAAGDLRRLEPLREALMDRIDAIASLHSEVRERRMPDRDPDFDLTDEDLELIEEMLREDEPSDEPPPR